MKIQIEEETEMEYAKRLYYVMKGVRLFARGERKGLQPKKGVHVSDKIRNYVDEKMGKVGSGFVEPIEGVA